MIVVARTREWTARRLRKEIVSTCARRRSSSLLAHHARQTTVIGSEGIRAHIAGSTEHLATAVGCRSLGGARRAFRVGRAIQAGRVWTNCYHHYPAHAAFGGYKSSGVGRENHRMMLDHYTQTKCLLVSYDPNPMGFF